MKPFVMVAVVAPIIAAGIGITVAGMIVVQQTESSPIRHYDTVGYVVVLISALSIFLMYRVNQPAKRKDAKLPQGEKLEPVLAEVMH